jgi:hypothetical protein
MVAPLIFPLTLSRGLATFFCPNAIVPIIEKISKAVFERDNVLIMLLIFMVVKNLL